MDLCILSVVRNGSTPRHVCAKPKMSEHSSFSELTAKDIDGNDRAFKEWSGNVVMVVNVASA